MFACRLSEDEQRALDSLLDISECLGETKSVMFRSIILELEGKLSRNMFGHLEFHGDYEEPFIEEEKAKEEERESDKLYSLINKLR